MDIQAWLDGTVLPEQHPSPLDQPSTIASLPRNGPEWVSPGKRKQEPTASDSSLLQPRKAAPSSPPAARGDSTGGGHGRVASSHSNGTASSTSSHPYARRPRRKTRLERYEPAPKHVEERGSNARRHRNRESSKAKHRHKRRKADKAGNDIVQSFHAKNVPKDRLTLKPRGKLGLFSKGRASSPVKGRGLPDLVFSEMKFLQSQRDQLEAEPEADPRTKRRKRDRAHAKEEAISAYFTSVQPALAEEDVDIQAKAACQRLRDGNRRGKERPSVVDNAIATVEPTDRYPSLGFGGRGPRHETESYISWSESMRVPSSAPAHPRVASTAHDGQLDSMSNGRIRGNFESSAVSSSRSASPSMVQRTPRNSIEHFQVSPLVPANRHVSRSSLLRHSNLIDQDAQHRPRNEAVSPPSMPPIVTDDAELQRDPIRLSADVDLARCKGDFLCDNAHGSFFGTNPRHELAQTTGHGADPRTSSTLGRMLENCDAALHGQHQASAVSKGTAAVTSPQGMFRKGLPEPMAPFPATRKTPTVRFSGVDRVYHAAAPSYHGFSIYEPQEERETPAGGRTSNHDLLLEEPSASQADYSDNEEYAICEMERQSNDETAEAEFDQISETSSADQRRPDQCRTASGLTSKGVVKPGFWRPNKLY